MTDEYAAIRPDIREALDRWGSEGRPVGDFLSAVLSNDLREATARADRDNAPALVLIVQYVYNRLPAACWGSPAKVAAWAADHEPDRAASDLTPYGRALLADATARVKDGRAATYQIGMQQALAERDL